MIFNYFSSALEVAEKGEFPNMFRSLLGISSEVLKINPILAEKPAAISGSRLFKVMSQNWVPRKNG